MLALIVRKVRHSDTKKQVVLLSKMLHFLYKKVTKPPSSDICEKNNSYFAQKINNKSKKNIGKTIIVFIFAVGKHNTLFFYYEPVFNRTAQQDYVDNREEVHPLRRHRPRRLRRYDTDAPRQIFGEEGAHREPLQGRGAAADLYVERAEDDDARSAQAVAEVEGGHRRY